MWNKISLLLIVTIPYLWLTFSTINAKQAAAKANQPLTEIVSQNSAE
jgi:hypothetical protein